MAEELAHLLKWDANDEKELRLARPEEYLVRVAETIE